MTKWEERTVQDAFHDVSKFATDLAASLENQIEACVSDGVGKANFFDIEETFLRLCGERLSNDRVKVKEVDLELFCLASFEKFFLEVCDLKHIKALDDERFDGRLCSSVLGDWKCALRHLAWSKDMKGTFLSCLKPIKDDGTISAVFADPETKLMSMKAVPQEACQLNLHPLFAFGFDNHASFEAFLDEGQVVSLLYTDEVMYGKAGNVAMTAFDIVLSMGGSEAIVESFYSVMDSQREVRQHHATLEDRTILDWATSNVLNSEGIISRAAKFYIDGVSSLHLPRHRVGTLKRKTSTSFKASQVLRHMKSEKRRYPFLS